MSDLLYVKALPHWPKYSLNTAKHLTHRLSCLLDRGYKANEVDLRQNVNWPQALYSGLVS